MRNVSVLILALFLSASAFASGDAQVVSITADKTTLTSGEAFTFVVRIRNNGPDAVTNLNLNFANTYNEPMYALSAVQPAGWQCSKAALNCWAESMPSGADVNLTYHAVAPATAKPTPFTLRTILGSTNDGNRANDNAELTIPLQASTHVTDLSLEVSALPNPIPRRTLMTLAYDVRNNGLQDLTDVRVVVYIALPNLPKVFNGDGWTCTPNDEVSTTCQRASLGGLRNASLSVRFETPDAGITVETRASVFTSQSYLDENLSDNVVYRTLSFGDAEDWKRILVPFPASETPGANGSLWKAEVSGVLESTTMPEIDGNGCGPIEDPCAPPPLNQLFDAADEYLVFESNGPQFFYVGSDDASNVTLATRVYDASKSATTAGAFIPMARDEDFSTSGFSLIAIPVAPAYRSMLRVYDASGADNRDFELSLYGDAESTPFVHTHIRLRTVDEQALATTAQLPRFPASAQVDLTRLIPAGYTQVRATIRPTPVDGSQPIPAMELWGFVSITNNETSHVTIVQP